MQDGEEVVSYCDHFENLDKDPHIDETHFSRYSEVKKWHQKSRDRLVGLCVSLSHITTFIIVNIFDTHTFDLCVCYMYVLCSAIKPADPQRDARYDEDHRNI